MWFTKYRPIARRVKQNKRVIHWRNVYPWVINFSTTNASYTARSFVLSHIFSDITTSYLKSDFQNVQRLTNGSSYNATGCSSNRINVSWQIFGVAWITNHWCKSSNSRLCVHNNCCVCGELDRVRRLKASANHRKGTICHTKWSKCTCLVWYYSPSKKRIM